jgi:hypothetical protein
MDLSRKIIVGWYEVFFLLIAIVFFTVFRVSLLLIYPILVLVLFQAMKWKLSYQGIFMVGFMFLLWIFSFRDGFFLRYNFLSFYYFLPFVLLLFAVAQPIYSRKPILQSLVQALTIVGIINNVFGIIQYARNPGDDNFIGIYGTFTVSQNGLSLLNGLLAFYYFLLYQDSKSKWHLVLGLFFIVCCVMGFYGAGMMALLLAILLYYFRFSFSNIVKLLIVGVLVISMVYLIMNLISPNTLDYNINILKKFWTASRENAPRKLIIVFNYFDAYLNHLVDFFFGSGPGTFNSRSAFMVGSPTYFNLDLIKSESKPPYFLGYAYTLWNPTNVGPYDGFMNQPFSSLLALLGEYGFVFTFLLGILLVKNYRNHISLSRGMPRQIYDKMYRFVTIYLVLLIVIDNYIEYPEISALLILIIKVCESQIKLRAYDSVAVTQSEALENA